MNYRTIENLEFDKILNTLSDLAYSSMAKERIKNLKPSNSLEEVIKKYELQIKERKLTLDIEGQMILEAERNMMVQAMDNLIGNAVKYCRDEGVIRIALNEKNIVISNPFKEKIGDNVKLSNLCKPFVMGDNSRGNKKGTGIGLAIVKNIIDIHGFSLKLECEDDIFSVIISVGKHKKG